MNTAEKLQVFGDPTQPGSVKGWCIPSYVWAQENLVAVRIPSFGPVLLNRSIARKAELLFQMFTVAPKFAYGWSVRHKMHDPSRGLSMHSWGMAIDLTFDDAKLSLDEKIPRQVINAFKDQGWEWGGDWKHQDQMHFQVGEEWLGRLAISKGARK